jgi:hypothetical protein
MLRGLVFAGRVLLSGLVLTSLAPSVAEAGPGKKPEDALKGRIILSERPFPASFQSDASFIAHMKKADTKGFKYGGRDKIPVEFMAFFAQPINVTQLQGTLYDVTERLEMRDNFPIYPGTKGGRVLASYFEMRKETIEAERRYKLVITSGYRGLVLAEADFAIKAD